MPQGEFRGWADRLALLLALASPAERVDYANLAVRSRKVADVVDRRIPIAAALGADLVTVLVGGNDLVGRRADARHLADRLGTGIRVLRATGCDVLVVTAFMPRRPAARIFEARFAAFNTRLRALAHAHGAGTGSRRGPVSR